MHGISVLVRPQNLCLKRASSLSPTSTRQEAPQDERGAHDRETDPHRLQQRQKQIDFGKNTLGTLHARTVLHTPQFKTHTLIYRQTSIFPYPQTTQATRTIRLRSPVRIGVDVCTPTPRTLPESGRNVNSRALYECVTPEIFLIATSSHSIQCFYANLHGQTLVLYKIIRFLNAKTWARMAYTLNFLEFPSPSFHFTHRPGAARYTSGTPSIRRNVTTRRPAPLPPPLPPARNVIATRPGLIGLRAGIHDGVAGTTGAVTIALDMTREVGVVGRTSSSRGPPVEEEEERVVGRRVRTVRRMRAIG